MDQDVKQKLIDRSSWEELLSKHEHFLFEINKPASLGVLWTRVHMNNARAMIGAMGNIAGVGVLEIGCGGGWFAQLVIEKGSEYVGLDLSPGFCRVTLERLKRAGLCGAVVCGDAENLPFREGAFKNAFTYEAMHHLPKPYRGVCEALRVSSSFTLGDEPAKLLKPVEFFMVSVLKRFFGAVEPSGYESFRFDFKAIKLSLELKGYSVLVFRQWTFVPKLFVRYESSLFVSSVYLSLYGVLNSFLKWVSHGLTIHVELRGS